MNLPAVPEEPVSFRVDLHTPAGRIIIFNALGPGNRFFEGVHMGGIDGNDIFLNQSQSLGLVPELPEQNLADIRFL